MLVDIDNSGIKMKLVKVGSPFRYSKVASKRLVSLKREKRVKTDFQLT